MEALTSPYVCVVSLPFDCAGADETVEEEDDAMAALLPKLQENSDVYHTPFLCSRAMFSHTQVLQSVKLQPDVKISRFCVADLVFCVPVDVFGCIWSLFQSDYMFHHLSHLLMSTACVLIG